MSAQGHADEAKRDEAHHHGVQRVLRAHQPAIEKREGWRHEQHQRRRNQHPSCVGLIHSLHLESRCPEIGVPQNDQAELGNKHGGRTPRDRASRIAPVSGTKCRCTQGSRRGPRIYKSVYPVARSDEYEGIEPARGRVDSPGPMESRAASAATRPLWRRAGGSVNAPFIAPGRRSTASSVPTRSCRRRTFGSTTTAPRARVRSRPRATRSRPSS